MKFALLVLYAFSVVMLLTSCVKNCPHARGNYLRLDGQADFDTLYNEVLYLPANETHAIDTGFYDRVLKRCFYCLTIDIAEDETIYVLKGNSRTDTVRLTYDVVLEYVDDLCEYQARPVNLQVSSTFSSANLSVIDNEFNTWRLWVEL